MKSCRKCHKKLSLFYMVVDKRRKDGHQSICKACKNKYDRKFRHTNLSWQKRHWQQHLQNTYGISLQDWNKLFNAQHKTCAICHIALNVDHKTRQVATDHDHDTGFVRGILCTSCNQGLGFFKDDIGLLFAAIQYLEKALLTSKK